MPDRYWQVIEVFDRLVIEEFITQGCPALTPASAGNQRSKLLRMAEALNPSAANRARFTPLPPSDPVRPYSASELAALRSWAAGQTTETRRRDAATLLALGAGAGLAVEDSAGITVGMVHVDEAGVLVAAPGRRARLVPVLAAWEAPIIEAAASIPEGRRLFGRFRGYTAQYLLTTLLVVSANIRKLHTFLAGAKADADGTLKRLTSHRTRRRNRLADYAPAATGDPPAA